MTRSKDRNSCSCPDLRSRRDFLRSSALGFGALAFQSMLGLEGMGREHGVMRPARTKRVIFLFMHGGPSQVDTFDYKPLLARDHGKPLPFAKPRVQFAETGNLLASPWKFKQHGQSGAWVSELFPEVASVVDDICFVKSLHGTNDAHGGALLKLHTGSDTFVRPSLGSWVTYGLGTENQDLPAFVTLCPTLGHGGVNNWSSAFLPARFQGVPLGNAGIPAKEASFPHLNSSDQSAVEQERMIQFVRELDQLRRADNALPDDAENARLSSFELAFRMQKEAPGVIDISKESAATRTLYGLDDKKTENFGRQCLLARRFAEAGVRFIQCTHSYKWDQHANLKADHEKNANEVDRPIAGLLKDLKSRGLLDTTLVVWAGEFGRTPTAEKSDGRDHNPHGFTIWMAGGGVRPGISYGSTDDYGYYATENKVDVHDFHATILHLLGLEHEKLTYRYAGRDFRLTDVAGRVVKEILA